MADHVPVARPLRIARILALGAIATLGIATIVLVPRTDLATTTFAGTSTVLEAADIAAGLGLIAAGLLLSFERPTSWSGVILSGGGVAWLASDWVGWDAGSPLARSVAMVAEPFVLAFVAHVVLADSRPTSEKSTRTRIAAAYVAVAIVSVGRALFRDPFLDPYCWSNCSVNVFLLGSSPRIGRALDVAWFLVSLVIGAVLAVIAGRRMATATKPGRRILWPMLVPGCVFGIATVARTIALVRQPLERTTDPTFAALFQVRAWTLAMLALGMALVVIRARRTRIAVRRLASDLGATASPGSFGSALAQATGDPSLHVVYPVPERSGYVDPSGMSVDRPSRTEGRTTMTIVREGREVAVVSHDAAVVGADQLRSQIGSAARLAVENERLQAQVLAQLHDLRASRARIVETGDAERRQLERNLHDGAQQRLLALSYELRRACAQAESGAEPDLALLLRSASGHAYEALAELRELAHGIYPAVLTEAGIGPAIWTLADAAPLPVEVGPVLEERFDERVERTAFAVVSEAVDAASRLGSDHMAVRVTRHDERLIVDVEGAGVGPFVHVADRVGALGGMVTSDTHALRVEIPCG